MQRRKHLTSRQRQDAKVEWRATNLRLRQKHLHSSQMNFEDYIDYVAGYYAKDNTPATGPMGGWTPPQVRATQYVPSSTSVPRARVDSRDSWEQQQERMNISKTYPIMPAYNKGPYMVIPLDELTTAGKK